MLYNEPMNYRRCGRSGVLLPEISLGLWHNFGGVDKREQNVAIIGRAMELGICHFDLADNYGPPPGSAEERFGDLLKHEFAGHRDEMFIATKAGHLMWPGPYGDWGSRKHLISGLDQSLRRLQLDYVDVGGGFFGGLPTKPQFDEYMALMAGILKRTFSPEKTALIVEPGMAVIGAPVSYVTSVIDVKDTISNRFVMIDGSRTNIDPFMTKSNYFRHIHYKVEKESLPKQVISGYTCMEHDRLYTAVNEPELSVGDRIVFEKVGAYTMCLTPLFIRYFPDVYVYDGQQMRKVRNAWTAEEYVQKSVWDKE